jgi:hypothetical protein
MKYTRLMIAAALMMLPIMAAAQLGMSEKVKASIPFDFVVGNRIIPAGDYELQRPIGAKTLVLRGVDAHMGLFTGATETEARRPAASYALVFHQYKNRHFLVAVKIENSRMQYQLPESKLEREVLARNVHPTEQILLASVK